MTRVSTPTHNHRAPDRTAGRDAGADPGADRGSDSGRDRITLPRSPHRETHFVELGGESAAERLRALARALPASVEAELLASRDEPGLHLLVCRGDRDALAELPVPAAARRWRFGPAAPEAHP